MEKLIELYNKHLQDRGLTHKCVEWEVRENINMLDQLKLFVKRLVEQDKIDRRQFEDFDEYSYVRMGHGGMWGVVIRGNDKNSDFLISVLSISDTPIEDLISYLK